MIDVLLVDDHALEGEGLRMLLDREADISVVAEAESLATLPPTTLSVDVVVADLVLPDGEAEEVVVAIRERFPRPPVVAVTMVDDPDVVVRCLAAGAFAYVPKHAAATDLIAAVRDVARGERYVEPSMGARLAVRATSPTTALPLSSREVEVLSLIATGHTNREIAGRLGIGLRTVEAHRASLSRKLGVQGRAELVRYAWEHRLLPDKLSTRERPGSRAPG